MPGILGIPALLPKSQFQSRANEKKMLDVPNMQPPPLPSLSRSLDTLSLSPSPSPSPSLAPLLRAQPPMASQVYLSWLPLDSSRGSSTCLILVISTTLSLSCLFSTLVALDCRSLWSLSA